ncbi:MAG TPA: MerR family transcriptional regulator, partial [Longimicrobium sp.]|nr:MerR family transcriptional regulator [Longimicrobium sp.]
MEELSIGEVARRTGVAASALRYWEDAGLLPAPRRVGGRRRYDADAVRRVEVLRSAQQAGFTLAEIRTPSPPPSLASSAPRGRSARPARAAWRAPARS